MSAPNWWGDWRPGLTPHTGDLQPTDLIECTSMSGGVPTNTAITGAQIIAAASGGGGLTVGTTAIASGTDGRVLFQAAGVLQQDASFFWDNTNKRLGVGATPATNVRLDVRAQGALSTDIAFRVRNSANTANIAVLNGNFSGSYAKLGIGLSSGVPILHNIDALYTSGTAPNISLGTSTLAIREGANSFVRFIGGGVRSIAVSNGAAHTGLGNAFEMYSADIVAGNAAPHFRTENGDIVKLYRVGGWGLPTGTFTRTTFNTATVTTAQLAERVAALIQDLRDNHQLLKA